MVDEDRHIVRWGPIDWLGESMRRRIQGSIVAAAVIAAAILPAGAASAANAVDLVEIAPTTEYSVVGHLVEVGGITYFTGTSPAVPGGSWLFSFDPGTGVVAPVPAASSLGGANALVAAGDLIVFLSAAEGGSQPYVYDPATGEVGAFDWPAGLEALPDQIAVLGSEIYLVMEDQSAIVALPIADPSTSPSVAPQATTPQPVCLDGTSNPAGLPLGLAAVGGFVYYGQSCPDVPGEQLFRRSSPTVVEAVGFPAPPAAAALVDTHSVFDGGDRTFFAAGEDAGEQHMYSFDPADLLAGLADLGGVNPGGQAMLLGATTWFMGPPGDRLVYSSIDGISAVATTPSDPSDLAEELTLVTWGDRLLFNGFRDITPTAPLGTRANYVYDPVDRSITRIGPDGAIVAPFITADGTAYVTAYAANGADGGQQHLYRVVTVAPAPLPATGADVAPWAALVLAAGLVGLGAVVMVPARRRSATVGPRGSVRPAE